MRITSRARRTGSTYIDTRAYFSSFRGNFCVCLAQCMRKTLKRCGVQVLANEKKEEDYGVARLFVGT